MVLISKQHPPVASQVESHSTQRGQHHYQAPSILMRQWLHVRLYYLAVTGGLE